MTIQRTSTRAFQISWLASFTGFALQQNTNLVSGTWTSVTNPATMNSSVHEVVVPSAVNNRFFRLVAD